jgi:hypothetical protein
MPLRFYRRVSLLPGLRVNLSRGAWYTLLAIVAPGQRVGWGLGWIAATSAAKEACGEQDGG